MTETGQTTRRGALGRALAVVGGLVGLGAASAAGASAGGGATTLVFSDAGIATRTAAGPASPRARATG